MGKPGRPKVYNIDLELLEGLAEIHCSNVEIASIIGCDPTLLGKGQYSAIILKGKEKGKKSLRRKMWDTAMSGNVTMQIWLSKQYLGFAEKVEQKTETKAEIVQFYLPKNGSEKE